jgi:hypothetical protein
VFFFNSSCALEQSYTVRTATYERTRWDKPFGDQQMYVQSGRRNECASSLCGTVASATRPNNIVSFSPSSERPNQFGLPPSLTNMIRAQSLACSWYKTGVYVNEPGEFISGADAQSAKPIESRLHHQSTMFFADTFYLPCRECHCVPVLLRQRDTRTRSIWNGTVSRRGQ